jgi:hypothetical protein
MEGHKEDILSRRNKKSSPDRWSRYHFEKGTSHRLYSSRRTTMGSTRDARRAGA